MISCVRLWTTVTLLVVYSVEHSDTATNRKLAVSWRVEENGFHREIQVIVTGPLVRSVNSSCDLCLLFDIPRGIYIDTYQMLNLQEYGGPQVYCKDEIDLEKAAHHSTHHLVFMYGTLMVQRNIFQQAFDMSAYQKNLQADMSFPLHLRYHKPSAIVTSVNVTLSKPEVLVWCQEDDLLPVLKETTAPCNAKGLDYCRWKVPHTDFEPDKLSFEIPVGRKQDTVVVILGTLVVTIGSCICLLHIIINKQLTSPQKPEAS